MRQFSLKTKVAGIWIAILLAAVSWGQGANVASDSRLKAPITVKMKIAQLPAALKQLSKQCGVKLENVQTINDLKVTVFVQDVPSGVVLAKIASVLGCEWKADGDLLRLVVDPQERINRDRFVDAEDTAARKAVEDRLGEIAQISMLNLGTVNDELSQQMAAQSGNASGVKFDPQRLALLQLAQNPGEVTLSQFFVGLDNAKVSEFWRGDVVAGMGTQPPSIALNTDSSGGGTAAIGANSAQNRRARRPPGGLPMFAQYDPLLYLVQVAIRGTVRPVINRPVRLIVDFAPTGKLAGMPYGKEILAWDQPVPADGDWAQIAVQASNAQSPNADHRLTTSDYLEQAFSQTHVAFISDGFRTPTATRDLNHGAGSFSSWMSTLKKENHLFTRFEDGVVMVRHGGFWRLRKFETPEELLAPLEAKAAKGKLGLDDYAAFAAKLTPEQAKPFSIPNGSVTVFDPKPLEQAMPAIQFYASLDSASTRKAAQEGIDYTLLNSAQRQLFIQAALEGVFNGAAGQFTLSLARLATTGDARGMGFMMRRQSIATGPTSIDGQAMLFGMNLSDATIYRVPLTF